MRTLRLNYYLPLVRGPSMQNQHSVTRLLLLAFCGLVLIMGAAFWPQRLATAQGTNLLTNGGFEGQYNKFEGDATRQVAPGWSPWNVARKPADPGFVNLTPEYRPAGNPKRVRSGSGAQEWMTFFATHTGGVFQKVNVAAGAQVRFSAFINVWSTSLDKEDLSEQPGRVRVRVGIDPNGGTDGSSASIVWKEAPELYDQYQEVAVDATAAGGSVTVFIESAPKDPVKNNNVYVDDASLTASGGSQPPAPTTAVPTVANQPTREGTIIPGATNTPTPVPLGPSITPSTTGPTAVPPTVIPTAVGGGETKVLYTVKAGDSLNSIARTYSTTVELIASANGINANGLIFVGQQIVVPIPATPTPIPPTLAPSATAAPVTPTAPVEAGNLTGPTVNGVGTYIVQSGDDLQRIAAHYGLTVEALQQLNGIVNPSQVVIGTVLVVPGPGNNIPGGTIAPTVLPTAVPAAGGGTHTVAVGENLFRIALRYNVTLDALMRANGITNANLVFVGQVLRIP
jgi:LysM repeat protein